MKTFIVTTTNFVTKMITIKALKTSLNKTYGNNTTSYLSHNNCADVTAAMGLYRKVCMNGGKIVINTLEEMQAWNDAIHAYEPVNKVESNICRVLKANATRGLEKRICCI